jgi:hypothetical protein
MPQPYDYSIGGTDPTEAFLKGVQIAQQGRQAQAEYLRAQAAQAEVQRKTDDANRKRTVFTTLLGPGATLEQRNEAMRQLPDDVVGIQTFFKGIDEGRQTFLLETARTAYNDLIPDASGNVNIQSAIDKLNIRADAAKNSGDTVLEKQIRDLASSIGTPGADPRLAQGVIDLQVRAVDPDAADKMTGSGDARAIMRGAGIDPYSEKGRELFGTMAFKQGQILLTGAKTPDGGEYTGTLQDYLARYGSPGGQPTAPNPTAPAILPRSSRPPGMTDDQLITQANAAVRAGKNVEQVFRQLQAWGVNP